MTIETPRLILRPFEETDTEVAHAWFSDPEVMRFIPRGRDFTMADTQRRIAGYRARQAEFGFSKWLVIHRETQQPIGDSGLMHLPDGQRVEMGYRFAKPFWGAGYAQEVGQAWIDWWGVRFPGKPLFADVHAEHSRSQRILSKLGFVHSHEEVVFEMPMQIWRRGGAIEDLRVTN